MKETFKPVNGKNRHLGRFDNEIDAAKIYRDWLRRGEI